MTDVEAWYGTSGQAEVMYETTPSVDDQPPQHYNSGSGRFRGRVCAGCHLAIRERHYLSTIDADWHTTCLVCSVCRMSLDSEPTCYVKDSRIYCKQDYFRSAATTASYFGLDVGLRVRLPAVSGLVVHIRICLGHQAVI